MRRLFMVLVLLAAGVLLLSGAIQTDREESATPPREQDGTEQLLSGEPSQPDAQEAMATVEVEQPHHPKATIIIWCTLAVIAIALAVLNWGIPRGTGNRKKEVAQRPPSP